MVYLVSFHTSLVTTLFCWGSLLGWCFLTFCFLTHMAASLDVLRQRAFPVFPRKVALAAAVLGMGLTVYLPIGTLLRLCAFSTCSEGTTGIGYLVNRLAYQEREPAPDISSGCGCRRHRAREPVRWSPLRGRRSNGRVAAGESMVRTSSRRAQGAAVLPESLAVPGPAEPRSHRAGDVQLVCRT